MITKQRFSVALFVWSCGTSEFLQKAIEPICRLHKAEVTWLAEARHAVSPLHRVQRQGEAFFCLLGVNRLAIFDKARLQYSPSVNCTTAKKQIGVETLTSAN